MSRVSSEDNVADPLTKALVQEKHDGHVRAIRLKCMSE